MCTLVLLYQPEQLWPLIIGANRDELYNRPWKQPARHWASRPNIVAGLDELGGGTWFGLNDNGVVAGIMNRRNTLGPTPGKHSRGELVLEALMYGSAIASVNALIRIDPVSYRAFNLVVADSKGAFWLRYTEASKNAQIEVSELPRGLSMITAYNLNDITSPRIHRYLPLFLSAPVPNPAHDDWTAWEFLLASREADPGAGPQGAMNVVTNYGFGTVSSLLLALPSSGSSRKPIWKFASGRPGDVPYHDVTL